MTGFRLLHWGDTPYEEALARQCHLVDELLAGRSNEALILTEHPHVYSMGRSTKPEEILHTVIQGQVVPVVTTDRGGRATYHGPGQTIAYVVRDMRHCPYGVRSHVTMLEESVLQTLASLGVQGQRDPHAPGVWVAGQKIAALGVRIRHGVAYHGVAINRQPDLNYYRGIVPCGLADRAVTSLSDIGVVVTREGLEELYVQEFSQVFGPVVVDSTHGESRQQ